MPRSHDARRNIAPPSLIRLIANAYTIKTARSHVHLPANDNVARLHSYAVSSLKQFVRHLLYPREIAAFERGAHTTARHVLATSAYGAAHLLGSDSCVHACLHFSGLHLPS